MFMRNVKLVDILFYLFIAVVLLGRWEALYQPFFVKTVVCFALCCICYICLAGQGKLGAVFAPSSLKSLWTLWVYAGLVLLSVAFSAYPLAGLVALKTQVVLLSVFILSAFLFMRLNRMVLWSVFALAGPVYLAFMLKQQTSGEQIIALLGNKNVIATVFLMGFFPMFSALLNAFAKRTLPFILILWAGMAGWGVCFYLTESRAGMAAACVGVCVYAFGVLCATLPKTIRFAVPLGIAAGLAGVFFIPGFLSHVFSSDVRLYIWEGVFNMIGDKPLFGHGAGTFGIVYPFFRLSDYFLHPRAATFTFHAHSFVLEMIAQIGIAGFLAFALLVAGAFYRLVAQIRCAGQVTEKFEYLGLFTALFSVLLHNLVDPSLDLSQAASILFWVLLGFAYANVYKKENTVQSGEQPQTTAVINTKAVVFTGLVCAAVFYSTCLSPLLGSYYLKKGVKDKFYGNLPQAAADFELAQAFNPSDPEIYFRKGFFQAITGQPEKSIATYRALTTMWPCYADVHRNLGILLFTSGDPAGAFDSFSTQLRFNPYDFIARSYIVKIANSINPQAGAVEQARAKILSDVYNQSRNGLGGESK